MAAKGKSSKSNTLMGRVLPYAIVLAFGVGGGYAWRSYAPVALPVESALVADKSSDDLSREQLREIARSANEKADRLTRERDALAARLKDLEQDHTQAERNLGDLQIKDVLKSSSE